MADIALHGCRKRTRLVVAVNENEDFFGIRHGADADRQRLGRNRFRIIAEEAGIHDSRIGGQIPNAGAGGEGGKRLIEGDVSVHADAAHKEVDGSSVMPLRMLIFSGFMSTR